MAAERRLVRGWLFVSDGPCRAEDRCHRYEYFDGHRTAVDGHSH